MTRFTIPLFLLSALVGSTTASAGGLLRGKGRRYLEGDLVGLYVAADIQYADGASGPDTTDNIVLSDGSIHRMINGPPGLSREHQSGRDNIQLPPGVWFEANGDVNLNGRPVEHPGQGQGPGAAAFDRAGRSLEEGDAERTPEQERNLAELRRNLLTDGTKTVLIVKVVGADASTTATEDRLRDSVLGTNGDPVTLKSQYDNCSHGQLQWNGAADRTTSAAAPNTPIANGAVTVQISNTVAGSDNSVIRNAVTSQLQTNFGVSAGSLADHVMVCVPPGTNGGWIGYAYYNYWLSVYNDNWCTYLSIQMHEIGHNLNLAHSNEAGTYKDQTGMMGYSYGQDNGPMMCFNNAKNWQLGWFTQWASAIVEPDTSWDGYLKGQVDYNHGVANDDKVLVQINGATEDLYVGFNRAIGHNSGTVEGKNQVTIHKRPNGTGNSASELVAKLGAPSTYMYTTLDGLEVTVDVLSIDTASTPAVAHVQIVHGNAPTGPTPPPTPAPTPPPTPFPTPAPSPPPTQPQPTPAPTTAAPTPLPTPVPTPPPTQPQPTPAPTTAQPTNQPTKFPTNPPTTAQPTPPQVACSSIPDVNNANDCPETDCVYVSDGKNGKCCVGHNEAASCAA